MHATSLFLYTSQLEELLNLIFSHNLHSQTYSSVAKARTHEYLYSLYRSPTAFSSAWSQSWSHFFILPPPKIFFCITPYLNATAQVARDLLKSLVILSDSTFRRSAVDQENLKPHWKSEKIPHFSMWSTAYYLQVFQRLY